MKKVLLFLISLVLLGGCASHMKKIGGNIDQYLVDSDKAVVVFMRPSNWATYHPSRIYDLQNGTVRMVGTLTANEKIAYVTEPGKHSFQSFGTLSRFMDAELEAGKVYYVEIEPHLAGLIVVMYWYTFHPAEPAKVETMEFKKLYNECAYVQFDNPGAEITGAGAKNILEDFAEWEKKSNVDKTIMRTTNGIPF